jgi:hypothetical protein
MTSIILVIVSLLPLSQMIKMKIVNLLELKMVIFFLIGIERQPKKELGDAEGDFGDFTDFVEAVSYIKPDGRLVFCFLEKLD